MSYYRNEQLLESPDFPFSIGTYIIGLMEDEIEPHSHEFIEFVYIANGRGEHSYKGSSYDISRGDIFIIEPDVEHAYKVNPGDEMLVYNVLFQPSVLRQELEVLNTFTPFINFFYVEPFFRQNVGFQSHLTLNLQEQIEITFLLDRLHKEFELKAMGYRFLIQTKLMEILIYLSRLYDHPLQKPLTTSASEQETLERVCKFIEIQHARPLTLLQMSQLCGMSQSAFTAKFKEYKGQTFLEYRNRIRIGEAKNLLATTNIKIISIAKSVGFEDLSNFSKTFKMLVGLSPGEYRKIKGTQ